MNREKSMFKITALWTCLRSESSVAGATRLWEVVSKVQRVWLFLSGRNKEYLWVSGVRHVLATWLHPHVCHFLLSDLGHVTAALQSSFVFWKTKSVMLSSKDAGWFHKIMNVKFSKSCYECHLLFFLSLRQCCQNVGREQPPHPVHVHFGSIYQGTCFSLLGPRLQFWLDTLLSC